MKENKWIKKKIRVGYVMKEKVVEVEEETKEGRTRRMSKEVVGCVNSVVGKNKFQ